VEAAY
ncbi:hypothetical protein MK534_05475, partial [Streptococcus gallolyticus subsp. gallolyticus]